jgi:hypothetical protein
VETAEVRRCGTREATTARWPLKSIVSSPLTSLAPWGARISLRHAVRAADGEGDYVGNVVRRDSTGALRRPGVRVSTRTSTRRPPISAHASSSADALLPRLRRALGIPWRLGVARVPLPPGQTFLT